MTAKILAKRPRPASSSLSYGRQLRRLIEDHQALAGRLVKLLEEIEDRRDHERIVAAKKQNGKRPAVSWETAAKRLKLN
jgi:hypothetical protein